MNRPYIVCHMLTALDGKITGPFMTTGAASGASDVYERINADYRGQGWLCGRVTVDGNPTFYCLRSRIAVLHRHSVPAFPINCSLK